MGTDALEIHESVEEVGKHRITQKVFMLPGGYIKVWENSPWAHGAHSIIGFLVDEDRRGQGIGGRLLDEVVAVYQGESIEGQVSSIASLKVLYSRGFREPESPDASWEEVLNEFLVHQNEGVNLRLDEIEGDMTRRRRRNAVYDPFGHDPHHLKYEYEPTDSLLYEELCEFELSKDEVDLLAQIQSMIGGDLLAGSEVEVTGYVKRKLVISRSKMLSWLRRAMAVFSWLTIAKDEAEEDEMVYQWSKHVLDAKPPKVFQEFVSANTVSPDMDWSLSDAEVMRIEYEGSDEGSMLFRFWHIRVGAVTLGAIADVLMRILYDLRFCYGDELPPVSALEAQIVHFRAITQRMYNQSNHHPFTLGEGEGII